jgi:hypothetical protein
MKIMVRLIWFCLLAALFPFAGSGADLPEKPLLLSSASACGGRRPMEAFVRRLISDDVQAKL